MTKGRSALRRWIAIFCGAQLLLLGLIVNPVFADPLQIRCDASTTCVGSPPNPVTQTTTDSTPTFNLIFQANRSLIGLGFLGVLVPTGPAIMTMTGGLFEESKTWNGLNGSSLGTLLGEPGMTDYTFASLSSASAQAGVTVTSFTVSEFTLGTFTSTGGGAAGISGLSLGPLPLGTVLVAWVEQPNNTPGCTTPPCVAAQTALSESLTVTGVPEPGSLALFATGLVSVGAMFGRRLFNRGRRETV